MRAPGPLLLLLLGSLPGFLAGASSNPVQDPPQHPVAGVLGESVSLPVPIPPGKDVAQIEWDFQAESGPARVIAEFTPGEWERPNPEDRFGQRLEKADGTTLRIKALEKEDSGVYTAHVRFKTAEVQEHAFVLQVSGESGPGGTQKYFLLLVAILILCAVVLFLKYGRKVVKKVKMYGRKVVKKDQESKNVCAYQHPDRVKLETLSGQESDTPNPPREELPGESPPTS